MGQDLYQQALQHSNDCPLILNFSVPAGIRSAQTHRLSRHEMNLKEGAVIAPAMMDLALRYAQTKFAQWSRLMPTTKCDNGTHSFVPSQRDTGNRSHPHDPRP